MNGDKRKFLFVSISGLISDIAWQVAKESHEVRYCVLAGISLVLLMRFA